MYKITQSWAVLSVDVTKYEPKGALELAMTERLWQKTPIIMLMAYDQNGHSAQGGRCGICPG